jgi:hypothetical protein
MEAGPCQDPSGLQRAFHWFYWKFANLASPFQTQLVIDTHMTVADTKTVVVDTHTMVADMYQKALTGQEASDHNRSVGATRYSPTPECLPSPRPVPG